MKLTLTSLNLQAFENWEERSPKIIEYLSKVKPDVIFFQETVFLPSVSPHNQAQLLNQTLGYPFEDSAISRLQVGVDYPTYREGLALLSKYPISSSDTLILKKSEGDTLNRILQMIDIKIGKHILRLGNVHFSITDVVDYATPHLKETLEILASRHEKRILMGDFNLSYLEDSSDLWGEEYIASTEVPYITYPSWHEGPKRTDYALIPNECSFDSIEVSGDGLSDHRALTVVIDIPDAILQTQLHEFHESHSL
ncbi:MAG: endonuclease/exonuclease/phosphatase family protein [Candidatus Microsaccharimonas sp.]